MFLMHLMRNAPTGLRACTSQQHVSDIKPISGRVLNTGWLEEREESWSELDEVVSAPKGGRVAAADFSGQVGEENRGVGLVWC